MAQISDDDTFEIPIVDFSSYSVEIEEENVKESDLNNLAEEICQAFKNIGFVYLKNYGISHMQVQDVHNMARKFFALPPEVKAKYTQERAESYHGWIPLGHEQLNPNRPFDLKEVYDINPDTAKQWPDDDLPEFKPVMMNTYKSCIELGNRILYLMGLGLKLKNPRLFSDNHNQPDKKPCNSTGRLVHYLAVPPLGSDVKPNQIGAGEHSDFGSITLLFQDDLGGFQVKNRKGEFVAAKPIPDTVVVNVADLMQRWTSDELVSTQHRVIMPKQDAKTAKDRISFVFFVFPHSDCLVECIHNSKKYEPFNAMDYLCQRLSDTKY